MKCIYDEVKLKIKICLFFFCIKYLHWLLNDENKLIKNFASEWHKVLFRHPQIKLFIYNSNHNNVDPLLLLLLLSFQYCFVKWVSQIKWNDFSIFSLCRKSSCVLGEVFFPIFQNISIKILKTNKMSYSLIDWFDEDDVQTKKKNIHGWWMFKEKTVDFLSHFWGGDFSWAIRIIIQTANK